MKGTAGRAAPDRRFESNAPDEPAPVRFSARWLGARLRALAGPLKAQQFCLALSGGLDSCVLLDALAALRERAGFRLRALHVDHGLHADSPRWAERAREQALLRGISCDVLRIRVRPLRGASVEAEARARRYEALCARLSAHESLITAHHQDDQLETLLIALMRGSGLRGLAGMGERQERHGHRLLRPLLAVSRRELERYARVRGLDWLEDPSNFDERFDRNYLRRRVLPVLQSRWPAAAAMAVRSAGRLAQAQELLDRQAGRDVAAALDGEGLSVSTLRTLPDARRRNALRCWLAMRGLPVPDHRRMREIGGPVLDARADATPLVRWPGAALRRFGNRLLAGSPEKLTEPPPGTLRTGDWDWRRRSVWPLGERSALALVRDRQGDIDLRRLPCPLHVEFRDGGERLRAAHGSLALKDLLQSRGIAPWDRARVPLLRAHTGFIAVADLWVDAACRSVDALDGGPRARLHWRRGDL